MHGDAGAVGASARQGGEAAEAETIAGARQPGHLPGVVAVALSAMSREANKIAEEVR